MKCTNPFKVWVCAATWNLNRKKSSAYFHIWLELVAWKCRIHAASKAKEKKKAPLC